MQAICKQKNANNLPIKHSKNVSKCEQSKKHIAFLKKDSKTKRFSQLSIVNYGLVSQNFAFILFKIINLETSLQFT